MGEFWRGKEASLTPSVGGTSKWLAAPATKWLHHHQVTTCTNWYFFTIAGQSVGKCLEGSSRLKFRASVFTDDRKGCFSWVTQCIHGSFLSALIAARDKTNKTWLITLCVALTYYVEVNCPLQLMTIMQSCLTYSTFVHIIPVFRAI